MEKKNENGPRPETGDFNDSASVGKYYIRVCIVTKALSHEHSLGDNVLCSL